MPVMAPNPQAQTARPGARAADEPSAPPESMYEIVTDQWGARAPIYRKGDTFYPSMLPPDRDMGWAVQQIVVRKLSPDDPRARIPPTGPTGEQTGVASDGWHSAVMPEAIPLTMVSAVVAAMRANGATAAMIEAVQRQAVPPPEPMPMPADATPQSAAEPGTPPAT